MAERPAHAEPGNLAPDLRGNRSTVRGRLGGGGSHRTRTTAYGLRPASGLSGAIGGVDKRERQASSTASIRPIIALSLPPTLCVSSRASLAMRWSSRSSASIPIPRSNKCSSTLPAPAWGPQGPQGGEITPGAACSPGEIEGSPLQGSLTRDVNSLSGSVDHRDLSPRQRCELRKGAPFKGEPSFVFMEARERFELTMGVISPTPFQGARFRPLSHLTLWPKQKEPPGRGRRRDGLVGWYPEHQIKQIVRGHFPFGRIRRPSLSGGGLRLYEPPGKLAVARVECHRCSYTPHQFL